MVKSQCYAKAAGLKKGPWTPEEDQKLLAYIEQHGHGSWQALPAKAGLQRCGKSCRLRWINYLRPDIKRGKFNLQEEQTIIQLHALVGNKWSVIAAHLPKRTDNEIKNYWNTHLKKRLDKMGIDPTTHKPKADAYGSGRCQSAELRHMAQWESARLEAEARLAGESKPLNNVALNHFQKQLGSTSSTTLHQTRPSRPPSLDVLKAWQNLVSGMFFNSNGQPSLESPTSTLNFPQKITPPPVSAPLFHENTSMEMITKNNDINIAGMNAEELNQMLQDKLMNASDADNAWNVDSFRAINEDARVDILDYKYNGQINMPSESCDEISLEDNKSYWNSLMSWVDAGPSYFPML